MPKNILIVTGSDYTPQVYDAFIRTKERGNTLFLLSDGSFEPRAGIFEQHYTYDLRYTDDVLKYMRKQPVHFDAVAIKTSEWLTPLVALLAKEYGCLGNDPLTAFCCRSKYHMRQRLEAGGIPIPRYQLCKSFTELKQAITDIGLPCVAKPVGGNASYGTFLIRSETDLDALEHQYTASIAHLEQKAVSDDIFAFSDEELDLLGVEERIDMVHDYLIEEFMEGPEISVDALVQKGMITIVGMEEVGLPSPPYFTIGRCFMPFLCDEDTMRSIEKITEETIKAMKITDSPIHMELILTDTGPKVVEIACRIGGDNLHDSIFQTTGYNMMEEAIMISLGEPRNYKIKTLCHTAMEFVRPTCDGVITSIDIPSPLRENPNITELEFGSKVGDHVAPPPKSFDSMGYINARGNTREEAQAHLDKALADITITIS